MYDSELEEKVHCNGTDHNDTTVANGSSNAVVNGSSNSVVNGSSKKHMNGKASKVGNGTSNGSKATKRANGVSN